MFSLSMWKFVRDIVGYEIPLAADHFGHINVESCIRLAARTRAVQSRMAGRYDSMATDRSMGAPQERNGDPGLYG